ncbi:protein DpdE [Shewanella sp. 3_MG-2023]|uniref:protein DpdE n=1 Tax=Shewanella sp. 3_MG-2023 TaxID=3062635 RepID=UPI0026E27D6A|nr:protein DpdE [Shewanella sp. 3_MG-2023]MDO6777386.1 protein DpdE [Shewanella sp. 3_MG-2023]
MMNFVVGSLVSTSQVFKGIGKVKSIDSNSMTATVGFFCSPLTPYANLIDVALCDLEVVTSLGVRAEVFVQFPNSQTWKIGHYDGERPGNKALVTFSSNMRDVFDFTELFVPNAHPENEYNPFAYLKGQATSSPYICGVLSAFYQDYYEQRRSCRSISSLISSSVELEKHQLAVVYEVLKDTEKKYLLCDEVGLGKTIEAGFIIRQHVLERGHDSRVLILVPPSLVGQWQTELSTRFHLGDLLNTNPDNIEPKIHICSFTEALMYSDVPSMVVVDEAHQISSFPFSGRFKETTQFGAIAELSQQAEISLLLTGTPMAGHKSAYFALLHLLNHQHFPLNDKAIETFNQTLPQQGRLREIYRIFKPENDDGLIDSALDDLESFDLQDDDLYQLSVVLRPLVDMFAEEVDSVARDGAIKVIADHLGRKYLYDYKMLRNSRATGFETAQNSEIEALFPGLNPAELIHWRAPEEGPYLDELFEQYRSEAIFDHGSFLTLPVSDFKQWSEALLTSPLCFAGKIRAYLAKNELSEIEVEHWLHMLAQAEDEQVQKNAALNKAVDEWLTANEDGKAIIFCGEKQTADNVYQYLSTQLDVGVERHSDKDAIAFNSDDQIRVLVCDEKGEDGLNLQGKKRLSVHYSMPLLLSRLEQRNGRLNRYSALSTGVSPIDTFILAPERDTFYSKWIEVLKEGVGCFEYYRANIQDEIDQKLELQIWPDIREKGYAALEYAIVDLQICTKEIYRSREIIAKLATVDLDAEKAEKILIQLRESDEVFEESNALSKWITEGILFDRQKEGEDLYRFRFQSGRTKLRSSTLLSKCIVGIDFESSSYIAPVTRALSFSRRRCVENGSYPLRYGQPFVDAIADVSKSSPFGNSSAIIRQIGGNIEPKLFFIPQWLVEAESLSKSEQIALDSVAPPTVTSAVYTETGQQESTPIINTLITAPYSSGGTRVYHGEQPVNYKDTNITISGEQELVDIWALVEQQIDKIRFNTALDAAHKASKADAVQAFYEGAELTDDITAKTTLLTIKYVLLFGGLS